MSAIGRVEKANEKLKKILMDRYRGDPELAESLIDVRVRRCKVADRDHYRNNRVYSHCGCEDMVICVSSSMNILDDENIYGILAHEYGHLVHSSLIDLVFGIENFPGELEVEIDLEHDVYIVKGVQVDSEILADYLVEKLFKIRIFYDEKKVQWINA